MTNTVKPIAPGEVAPRPLPDAVVSIINDMIRERISEGTAVILVEDLARQLASEPTCEMPKMGDVVDLYCSVGWEVEYVETDVSSGCYLRFETHAAACRRASRGFNSHYTAPR